MDVFPRRSTLTVSVASLAEPVALRAAWTLARSVSSPVPDRASPTGANLVRPETWHTLLRQAATVLTNPRLRIELVQVHDAVALDANAVDRHVHHVLTRMRAGADVVERPYWRRAVRMWGGSSRRKS